MSFATEVWTTCAEAIGGRYKTQVTGLTPFAVHYEKIRIHLCELTTNSAKMHS